MSTLERPDGDEPDEGPDEVPADPPPGAEADAVTVSEAAESEPEGSSLERGEAQGEDPLEASEIAVDRTRVRRAPRFGRFVTMGVLLGLLVALVQTRIANPDTIAAAGGPWAPDAWGFFWLMCAIFVPLGALLMCGIALLADRRSRRVK